MEFPQMAKALFVSVLVWCVLVFSAAILGSIWW